MPGRRRRRKVLPAFEDLLRQNVYRKNAAGIRWCGNNQNMKVEYDRYGRKHEKRNVCPLPFYMLGIFPNGDVEPCDTIYKPIVLGQYKQLRINRHVGTEKN